MSNRHEAHDFLMYVKEQPRYMYTHARIHVEYRVVRFIDVHDGLHVLRYATKETRL